MASLPTFDTTSFIYRSPRPMPDLPSDPFLDMTSFLFLSTSHRHFHNRLALIDSTSLESITFSQLRLRISHTARCLSFLGVRQHDVVLLFSPNSVSFPIIFLAVVSLGAVLTTANPLARPRELFKQIKDAGATLVITVPDLLEKVVDFGLPILLIGGEALHKKNLSVRLLSEAMDDASAHRVPAVRVRQTDTAALLYSSGTTGVPKGVILTHGHFISSSLQVNVDAVLHNERDLTILCVIPMFHVYGLSVVVYGQLQCGNTIVTMPKFDFIQMLEAVQRYQITNLPLVPPIVIALTKQDVVQKYDLGSVIELTSGAAPLGKETLEELSNRLNIPDARQGYGMTETCGIISLVKLKCTEKKYASVGPLVAGMEAVVIDPSTGKRLPPNKQGELWVRGPNIMQGYLNNQEATSSTLDKDGWLHTGDLVYIDDEGSIFVMDRLKELIKYKGLQVAPAELEALLLTHSEILDAAVVPCPDDDAGEIPIAYVVRSNGSSLSENDVIQFVAAQVAPYKRVRKVNFINAIPKSTSGKILRRELAQQAKSKL